MYIVSKQGDSKNGMAMCGSFWFPQQTQGKKRTKPQPKRETPILGAYHFLHHLQGLGALPLDRSEGKRGGLLSMAPEESSAQRPPKGDARCFALKGEK